MVCIPARDGTIFAGGGMDRIGVEQLIAGLPHLFYGYKPVVRGG
jgi:hypothetical protein